MASTNVSLIEMSDAFDKLCTCITKKGAWQKLNFDTFYDMGLTRNEALVIAWLHVLKNIIFNSEDMSVFLGIKKEELEDALFSLFAKSFITRMESDKEVYDVVDLNWIKFSILDKQACRASSMIPKPIKRGRPKTDNWLPPEELGNMGVIDVDGDDEALPECNEGDDH